jgi:hypothetical protein
MDPHRRTFLKKAVLGGACLSSTGRLSGTGPAKGAPSQQELQHAYRYRIAFGAWINDMRNEPLPLQDWPAPQLDDETISSTVAAMDVQSEAGFNMLDVWGLFATKSYPTDIDSAFDDPQRLKGVRRLLAEAERRKMGVFFGMGLMSWGYTDIIRKEPEVAGRDRSGHPLPNAMCGAKDKSWQYVQKVLDRALNGFPFVGVHLESADMGWCDCPQCGGKDGTVGYNIRLNIRAADYIKDRWPGKIVTCIPINWLNGTGQRYFNEQDKTRLIELSKHIDCFMDQGWRGHYIADSERADFIKRMHCCYGTSGDVHLYPSVRWDRSSYFLPYANRTGKAIKRDYAEGARACLFYQGPVVSPSTEVNIAVGGRLLSDTTRNVEDTLAEVIQRYYRPAGPGPHDKLVKLFLRAEEAYCGQWDAQAFLAQRGSNTPWCGPPGEFYLNEALFGDSPGPPTFLMEPYLSAEGRRRYRTELMSLLRDLASIEGRFDDGGRIQRIRRGMIITLNLIDTIRACKGEAG